MVGAKEFLIGFFTMAVLKVAIVNIIGGTLFGYSIGFVGVYTSYESTNQNCTLYKAEASCSTLKHASCTWVPLPAPANGACLFNTAVQCNSVLNESNCNAVSYCIWDSSGGQCHNPAGYTTVQTGVFACSMIIGGLLGSLAASDVVRRLGRKKSIIIAGAISVVGSILIHICAATDTYALLIVGRILIGIGSGVVCVACPMYVEEMAPADYRKPIGVMFQVFCTLGIAIAAIVGLALNPTDFTVDVNMPARFQGFVVFSTFFSAALVVTGVMISESIKWLSTTGEGEPLAARGDDAPTAGEPTNVDAVDTTEYTWGDMSFVLLIASIMAIAQQFTGINAIMNYAPTITKSMGFQPLTGNMIVMIWNFVTTIASIPLASRLSMRQMFLGGTLIASLACLCTGIPVYPGVTSPDTKHALAGLGIAIFILAFEVGMGPCFYVLCQELFPTQFRPKGSSYTMVFQFALNIIMNLCFPIAVENLSGGAGADQDKGMGITFMFFGVCGLLSFVVLVKFLHPFTTAEAKQVE